jgi:hypothetical protein
MNKMDSKNIDQVRMSSDTYHKLKRMAEDGVRPHIIVKHTDLPEEIVRNFITHQLEKHISLFR